MSAAGGPDIIEDGLVLNFDAGSDKCNPGGGTTLYDPVGGGTGTLQNGSVRNRNNGGSLVFDGTNDYADINFSFDVYNDGSPVPFTMEVWALHHQEMVLESGEVFAGAYGSSRFMGMVLGPRYKNGSTQIRFNAMYGGVGSSENSTYIDQDQKYHQYVMTLEPPNTSRVYIDGTLKRTRSVNVASSAYFTNIRMAKNRGGAVIPMTISSIRVYDRQLSLSEIQKNYDINKNRFGL